MSSSLIDRRLFLGGFASLAGCQLAGCAQNNFTESEKAGTWLLNVGDSRLHSLNGRNSFTVHSGTIGLGLPDGEVVALSRATAAQRKIGARVDAKDNSAMEILAEVGPLPATTYSVGGYSFSAELNRFVIELNPELKDCTYGRSLFRLHVINPDELGTAGCIGFPSQAQNGRTGAQIMDFLHECIRNGELKRICVVSSNFGITDQMQKEWRRLGQMPREQKLAELRKLNDIVAAEIAPALPGNKNRWFERKSAAYVR